MNPEPSQIVTDRSIQRLLRIRKHALDCVDIFLDFGMLAIYMYRTLYEHIFFNLYIHSGYSVEEIELVAIYTIA